MIRTINRKPPRHAAIALIVLSGTSGVIAAESAANTPPIPPYVATFKADSKGSISASGTTTRQLSQLNNLSWKLSSESSALFARIDENSTFTHSQNLIAPHSYYYKRKVLGKTREAALSFDWQKNSVTNNVANQPWQMPISDGVQDKLSYQLQLRLDLINGKELLEYKVADGGRLKEYRFEIIGKEHIETPAGSFDSIKVRRLHDSNDKKTLIWFAPSLNYQMIKLYRQTKKDKAFALSLQTLKTR